jgi:hypothetical protein
MECIWRHVKDKLSCHRRWADGQALWEVTPALLTQLTARFHKTIRRGIEVVQKLLLICLESFLTFVLVLIHCSCFTT